MSGAHGMLDAMQSFTLFFSKPLEGNPPRTGWVSN